MLRKYAVFINDPARRIILLCYNADDLFNKKDHNDRNYWLTYRNMVPDHYELYYDDESYGDCLDCVDKICEDYGYYRLYNEADRILIAGYKLIPNN